MTAQNGAFAEEDSASALRKKRQEAYRLSLEAQQKAQDRRAEVRRGNTEEAQSLWPGDGDEGEVRRQRQDRYRESVSRQARRQGEVMEIPKDRMLPVIDEERKLQATKSGRLVLATDIRRAKQKQYLQELSRTQPRNTRNDDGFYLPPPGPILEDPGEQWAANGKTSKNRRGLDHGWDRKQRYLTELQKDAHAPRRRFGDDKASTKMESFDWGTNSTTGMSFGSPMSRHLTATQGLPEPTTLANIEVYRREDQEAVQEVRRATQSYLRMLRDTLSLMSRAQERGSAGQQDVMVTIAGTSKLLEDTEAEIDGVLKPLQLRVVEAEKLIFEVESKELAVMPQHNLQRRGAREDLGDPFMQQLHGKFGTLISQLEQATEQKQLQVLKDQEHKMTEEFKEWQQRADETLDGLLQEAFDARVIEDKELDLLERSIRDVEDLEAHDIHEQLQEEVNLSLERERTKIQEHFQQDTDPNFSHAVEHAQAKICGEMEHINQTFMITQKKGFSSIVDLAEDLEGLTTSLGALESALDPLMTDLGSHVRIYDAAEDVLPGDKFDPSCMTRDSANQFVLGLIAKSHRPRSGRRNAALLATVLGYEIQELTDKTALESRIGMLRLYQDGAQLSCGNMFLESAELAIGGPRLGGLGPPEVLSHPLPKASYAIGSGLENSVAGLPCTFTICTASQDGLPLLHCAASICVEVFREDSGGQEAIAQLPAREKEDGTYMVQSIYESPGKYEISVSIGQIEIPGSPFRHEVHKTFEGVHLFTEGGMKTKAWPHKYYDNELLSRASKYPTVGTVDLQLIVDCTASMGRDLESLVEYSREIIAVVKSSPLCLNLQVGVILYRDHWPEDDSPEALSVLPLTSQYDKVIDFIKDARPGGGGDYPEALGEALALVARSSSWRPFSSRVALVVGDAPPHGFEALSDAEVAKRSELLESLRHGAQAAAKLLETSTSEAVLSQAESDLRAFLHEIDERMSYYDSFPKGDPTGSKWFEQCELLRASGIPLICVALRDAVTHLPTRNCFLAMAQATGGCYYPMHADGNFSFLPALVAMFVDEGLDKRLLEEEVADCAITQLGAVGSLSTADRTMQLLKILRQQQRPVFRMSGTPDDAIITFGERDVSKEDVVQAIIGIARLARILVAEFRTTFTGVTQWLEAVYARSTSRSTAELDFEERMVCSANDLRYLVASRVVFGSAGIQDR